MRNLWLFTSIFLMLTAITGAQENTQNNADLQVEVTLSNPSREINDGIAEVIVTGGEKPYQYKWTNQSTALDARKSTGLIEGMEHTIKVTDANNKSVSKSFTIPAESITEIFNSNVQPAVDFLGGILFWDPFASLGVFDPVVYTPTK